MRLFKIVTMIIPFLSFLFVGLAHAADDDGQTKFQKGSETTTEETTEIKDGKEVRKIRSGRPVEREGGPRVGEIEENEVHQIERRQKSLSLSAIGFGPYGSSNVGDKSLLYGFSLGHHWEVSTQGEIVAEAVTAVNSKGFLLHGGMGFNFIPLTGQFSPVIGGELGIGTAYGRKSDEDSKSSRGGFSYQVNVGARMFRLSTTQMEIMGTYTGLMTNPAYGIFGAQLRVLF